MDPAPLHDGLFKGLLGLINSPAWRMWFTKLVDVINTLLGGGPAPAPSATVVTETAWGQASNAGALGSYSRGNHTHGTPVAPTAASVGALATVTGTGFVHITAGVEDAAAKLVENVDVHATAGIVESKLSLNYPTHAEIHGLVSANHTVAGLTPGHFLKATGAATFGFTAHGLTAADVGAPALVNPSVVGNFVSFSNITGSQQDSGSKAADFVVANVAIVAATKTKITYDTKGLITAGADASLASADFANQGTTTTLLHGNAAGNPSWSQIVNNDVDNAAAIAESKLALNYATHSNANDPTADQKTYLGGVDAAGGFDWITGNIIYVPLSGNIQTYINAAAAGDTLILASGTYTITSAISINKSINIVGQGINNTILNKTNGSDLLSVIVSNIRIANMSLTHSGSDCITIRNNFSNLTNLIFENLTIDSSSTTYVIGFYLINVSAIINQVILNVTATVIDNPAYGIYLSSTSIMTQNYTSRIQDCIVSVIGGGGVSTSGGAAGVGVLTVNASFINTLNLYNCVVSAIIPAGTDESTAVYSTYNITFPEQNSVVNCYASIFNGGTYDAECTGTDQLNIIDSYLYNNLSSGTLTYRPMIINAHIHAAAAILFSKLATTNTNVVLGRVTAGGGAVEEISCTAAGRSLLDDATAGDQINTLFVNKGTTVTVLHGNAAGNPSFGSIVNADVDVAAGILFSKLATTNTGVILGRNTAGGGAVEELMRGYQLIATQILTGSGTYTPTAGTRAINPIAIGAGAGGGGAAQSATLSGAACGGGGGGYSSKFITSLAASYAYSVGTGGAGGAAGNNNGTNGGDTTFGSPAILTANGGTGGGGTPGGTGAKLSIVRGQGGSASGGDINLNGGAGGIGVQLALDTNFSGFGGASLMGFGGRPVAVSSVSIAGPTGFTYGGGGAGAASFHSNANVAGGNGANGTIIVQEFV